MRSREDNHTGVDVPISVVDGSSCTQRDLRSAAHLLVALQAGRMGTWVLEIAEGDLQWGPLATKLLGYESDSSAPDTFQKYLAIIHAEDRNRVRAAFESALHDRGDCDVEYRVLRPDNTILWVNSRGNLQYDKKGRPLRMVGILVDIDARKHMEDYLLQAQKLQALGKLAGGIAHDFNNILMAIGGSVQLAIEQTSANNPIQHLLNNITVANSRAKGLVQEILAFSCQQEQHRKVIDAHLAFQDAVTMLRATLPPNIEIRSNFPRVRLRIRADASRIEQVVMNLGANAAQAIGSKQGLVEISIDQVNLNHDCAPGLADLKRGPYIRVIFRDNGCGMKRELVSRIFEPFFTTRSGEGAGLGLSVVHGIMKSHEGTITVESEFGKGSRFDLYFPALQEATQERLFHTQPALSRGRGEHILYVDDEQALLSLVTRSLQRLGYQVFGYTDGENAVRAFGEHPEWFDIVISDVTMPRMSGWELCRSLLAIRSDIPVVMTSGYVRNEEREMARRLGVLEVVVKPDSVDELARALHRALNHAHQSKAGGPPMNAQTANPEAASH